MVLLVSWWMVHGYVSYNHIFYMITLVWLLWSSNGMITQCTRAALMVRTFLMVWSHGPLDELILSCLVGIGESRTLRDNHWGNHWFVEKQGKLSNNHRWILAPRAAETPWGVGPRQTWSERGGSNSAGDRDEDLVGGAQAIALTGTERVWHRQW